MTQLTLAKPEHVDAVEKLVADFHGEYGVAQADADRAAAIRPLLDGSPHGAIYLAGPARAPVGYVSLSFTWALQLGGLQGLIDEIYIRPGVRGRGIGSEILHGLPAQLASFGMKAVHLQVHHDNDRARRIYEKLGFVADSQHIMMTKIL